MSTHRHIDAICVVIVLAALVLTVLFMNGEALGITAIATEDGSGGMFTENDLDGSRDVSNAAEIILSDLGSEVHGNGAYVSGGDVHIVYAGSYVLTGELSDGSVIIEADGDDKIWLILDGVSVNCSDGAALRVEQAGKVFLTLRDGTENTFSSGESYSAGLVSSGVDGTIYSRDDLTINGGGALTVTALYQHGIVCNDDLVITGGTISVTAVQDGIHANDSVRIRDADLTVSAGDDGITVSNDDGTAFFYMESGSVTVPACYEGIEARQITIAGGTINISASDDGLNANGDSRAVIYITGGDITLLNENGRDGDGIDSNGDIYISGGRLFISVSDTGGNCAIDYGSESGGVCEISGGTVLACGSANMAESFSASSPQGFLMSYTSASAGTTVTLKSAGGSELLSETAPYSFSSVLVSTPEMSTGDAVTLIVGDTETEMTVGDSQGSGAFGFFGGGIQGGRGGFGGGMTGGEAPPEMPDGENSGRAFEGGKTPDGEFQGGTMPDGTQGKMGGGHMQLGGTPGEENAGMGRFDTPADPVSAEERKAQSDTLLLVAASVLALGAGIVIAAVYKRKN